MNILKYKIPSMVLKMNTKQLLVVMLFFISCIDANVLQGYHAEDDGWDEVSVEPSQFKVSWIGFFNHFYFIDNG